LTSAISLGIASVLRRLRGSEERFGFPLHHKDLAPPKSSKVSFILFAGFP
jgi:hypothetical protein